MKRATQTAWEWTAVLLLAVLQCCKEEEPPALRKPDVLLVTLDTTREDVLSELGGNGSAPHLDALARGSILCLNARAPAPLTAPSHASMMTGLYPFAHGVRDNDLFRLSEEARTLALLLQESGYRTEAVIGASVLRKEMGLDRGFESYDELPFGRGRELVSDAERPAKEVTDRAIARSARTDERPLFLWVHYFDPHYPYVAHELLTAPLTRASVYLSEVKFMDAQLGRLLQEWRALGRYEDSTILVLADHGEGLNDQQELTHGFLLEEETLRIPFLVKLPRSGLRGKLRTPTSTVDVFPTALKAAGLPLPYSVHGQCLQEVFAKEESSGPARRALYVETWSGFHLFRWSKLTGIVVGDWKYIQNAEEELFAVGERGAKEENRATFEPNLTKTLRGELQELLSLPTPQFDSSRAEFSAEESTRLQLIGYLARGESDSEPGSEQRLPNPRLHYWSYVDFVRAQSLAGQGKAEEAITLLHAIAAKYPQQPNYEEWIGRVLLDQKDYESASVHLRKALEIKEGLVQAHLLLGYCCAKLQRWPEAKQEYLRVLELYPAHLDAMLQLREAHRQLREFGEVLLLSLRIVELSHPMGDEESALILRETLDQWIPATLRNLDVVGGKSEWIEKARALLETLRAPELQGLSQSLR